MTGEPQGPPLLAWALAGLASWAVLLGWLVSPWLELAGAVVLAAMLLYGLEWVNRGR